MTGEGLSKRESPGFIQPPLTIITGRTTERSEESPVHWAISQACVPEIEIPRLRREYDYSYSNKIRIGKDKIG